MICYAMMTCYAMMICYANWWDAMMTCDADMMTCYDDMLWWYAGRSVVMICYDGMTWWHAMMNYYDDMLACYDDMLWSWPHAVMTCYDDMLWWYTDILDEEQGRKEWGWVGEGGLRRQENKNPTLRMWGTRTPHLGCGEVAIVYSM